MPTLGAANNASSKTIPWTEVGAVAGAQYSGDGLTVLRTERGARLRCLFQRLEGEVTDEGLWITSTVADQTKDRFRVTAATIGEKVLPREGEIAVEDQIVRFSRPGLIEEYLVSMDGVRQDFVVLEKPTINTPGELRMELAVTGARVEQTAQGAQLILASGRRIAYARLRVTDAAAKELPACLEVTSTAAITVVVNDANAVYPVRIDPTFSDANWISMGGILGVGVDGFVYAAVADASANLYVVGIFTIAGGALATNIAKWNGSTWSALGSGMGGAPDPGVTALVASSSDLYAGGDFTTAGGSPARNIAKWDGSNWSPLGSGMDYAVRALAVLGSDLYAGGNFTTAGGNPANRIAKWNGSSWSALGSGMNSSVTALAVLGSDLYAGGGFTTAGGVPANFIAKWNGSSWSALGSGMNSSVTALAVSGGDLYAGGWFTTAGGMQANYIAKWNGTSWSALGSGMNNYVNALAILGNDLYAGGWFTTAGGKVSAYLARAVLGDAPGYNQLNGALSSGGAMQFSYVGYPATNYALDRTFNLSPPVNWVGQQTNTMTVSGELTFTNTPVTGTNNFWRVRSVP